MMTQESMRLNKNDLDDSEMLMIVMLMLMRRANRVEGLPIIIILVDEAGAAEEIEDPGWEDEWVDKCVPLQSVAALNEPYSREFSLLFILR